MKLLSLQLHIWEIYVWKFDADTTFIAVAMAVFVIFQFWTFLPILDADEVFDLTASFRFMQALSLTAKFSKLLWHM